MKLHIGSERKMKLNKMTFPTSIVLCVITLLISNVVFARPLVISEDNLPASIPADVKKEIKKLDSTEPEKRGYAVFSLGQMGSEATAATPFLIQMFDDRARFNLEEDSLEIPEYARRECIVHIDTTPAVEASMALVKIGISSVIEPLIKTLNDSKWEVQEGAIFTLGELKEPKAIAPLSELLIQSNDPRIINLVIRALEKIGDRKIEELLIRKIRVSTNQELNCFLYNWLREIIYKNNKNSYDYSSWMKWYQENVKSTLPWEENVYEKNKLCNEMFEKKQLQEGLTVKDCMEKMGDEDCTSVTRFSWILRGRAPIVEINFDNILGIDYRLLSNARSAILQIIDPRGKSSATMKVFMGTKCGKNK
jgi:hypothetical protein